MNLTGKSPLICVGLAQASACGVWIARDIIEKSKSAPAKEPATVQSKGRLFRELKRNDLLFL